LWILGLVLTALIASFALHPCHDDHLCFSLPGVEKQIQIPLTCMFRIVTGIPCPGCGLTRSFVAISHGDIRAAWEFNAMGPILYLLCILQIPYRPVEYFGVGRNSRTWTRYKQRFDLIVWMVLAGFILAWVVKLAS
jgi:hypothetical protein